MNPDKNKKKLTFSIAVLLLSSVALIGITIAFFTDTVSKPTASSTAGTVKIAFSDTNPINLINPNGNIDNFNPGDGRLINVGVNNTGNKSVDVKETLVLTPTSASSTFLDPNAVAGTPMGWAIYNASDCKQDSTTQNWTPNTGAQPVVAPTVANGKITYVLPDAVLNGTGSNAETETGVTITTTNGQFVLYMLTASDNRYQGATLSLDVKAQAKQHRNTTSAEWASLQTVNNTVPASTQTSTGATY